MSRRNHLDVGFDIRAWTFGVAGPYIGYAGKWWNFYVYLGPLSFNLERVRAGASSEGETE